MEAILVVAVIAIIIFVVAKKKKKSGGEVKNVTETDVENAAKEFYTDHIRNQVKIFTENQEFYDGYYSDFLVKNDVPFDTLRAMIEMPDTLNQLKSYFKAATVKLCEAAKGNSVFINTQEEKEDFSKLKFDENDRCVYGFKERDEQITKDIVAILPHLTLFLKCYQTLYVPYDKSFYTVVDINRELYIVMKEDGTQKDYERFKNASKKRLWNAYDLLIEGVWESLQQKDPELHSEQRKHIFMDVAENDEEAHGIWIKAWYSQFFRIGNEYLGFLLALHDFFEEIDKEYCPLSVRGEDESWLLYGFRLPTWNPSMSLTSEQMNADECERILALYTDGKMKGKYSEWDEQMALEKAKREGTSEK